MSKDDELHISYSIQPFMIKKDKVPMCPCMGGISNIGEMVIQIWNAKAPVDLMVFGPY